MFRALAIRFACCDRPGRGVSQRWHSGLMGLLIRLVELLIVIVPLVAVIVAGVKAVSMARGRQNDAPTEESPRARKKQSISPVADDHRVRSRSTTGRTPAGWTTNSTSASFLTFR